MVLPFIASSAGSRKGSVISWACAIVRLEIRPMTGVESSVFQIRMPFPPGLLLGCDVSDVALLGGLLVARVHDAVDDDGDQQNRTLDQVLDRVLDVHDRHPVQENADQQRT